MKIEISSRGGPGLAYIAFSDESGPLDQTDIDRTVFLNPLGRRSIIHEADPDWLEHQGGRPRGEGGRPVPGPVTPPARSRGFWTLLDGRKVPHTLISLCNHDMWAFPSLFPDNPLQKQTFTKTCGILSV